MFNRLRAKLFFLKEYRERIFGYHKIIEKIDMDFRLNEDYNLPGNEKRLKKISKRLNFLSLLLKHERNIPPSINSCYVSDFLLRFSQDCSDYSKAIKQREISPEEIMKNLEQDTHSLYDILDNRVKFSENE